MGGGAQTTEGTELAHMPTPDITHLNTFSYEWQVLYEAKLRNPSIKLIGTSKPFPASCLSGFVVKLLIMIRKLLNIIIIQEKTYIFSTSKYILRSYMSTFSYRGGWVY